MGLLADRLFLVAAFERKAAPLGPVTTSAEPSPASKESPANRCRPPRSIVKSHALRRIDPLTPCAIAANSKTIVCVARPADYIYNPPTLSNASPGSARMASLDSFKCRKTLTVGAKTYEIYSLKAAEKNGLAGVSQLPFSLKIVLENLLRNEDGRSVKKVDI